MFFLSRFELRESDLVSVPDAVATALARRSGDPELPLASVSLGEAVQIARHFWARVPTLEEWRGAVEGRSRFLFPWGDTIGDQLRTNTANIGLWRRTRVGTFESGRNLGRSDSCYDLIGNVAEWTITPSAVVRLELLRRTSTEVDEMADRADALVLLRRSVPIAALDPSAIVGLWNPELHLGSDEVFSARFDFCAIGLSCGQLLPPPSEWDFWGDRLGVRHRGSRERRWDLGLRMATDPYCLLAGLQRAEGSPTEDEAAALREFLSREREAFRSAARLLTRRLGSAEDEEWLGRRRTPSAWARVAHEFLSVRLP